MHSSVISFISKYSIMRMSFLTGSKILGGASFFAILLAVSSCNKNASVATPRPPGNEFLTTVELAYVNQNNAADNGIGIWRQLDPTGAAAPDTSKAIINLKANSTYTVTMILLDETKHPVDTVSIVIRQRQNYHLEYYQPTPISAQNLIISNTSTDIPVADGTVTSATGPYLNLVVTRTDYDNNTPPMQVGLNTIFATGAASNGRLRVVQRHQPNVKNGTYEPGSADFDTNFTVNIN
jgi:hypothetical protein